VARFFFLAATGGGPGMRPGFGPPMPIERTMIAGFLVDLLIVAAIVHDWRSDRRVHQAYWWGLGAMLAVQLLRPVIGHTQAWYGFTDFLLAF
jgi:hypothetical protein